MKALSPWTSLFQLADSNLVAGTGVLPLMHTTGSPNLVAGTGVLPLMHTTGSPGRVSKHNIMCLGR
jgi:hypothetical protein